MTSPLSFMIGLQPTNLDAFVARARPAGLYGLNHTVRYPGVLTVRRVQNDVWDRLPDACGIERYFETEDPVASARYELTEKTIGVKGQRLNLLQYWGLSNDDYYAPYNEWVLGEVVEVKARNGRVFRYAKPAAMRSAASNDDARLKATWMSAWTCEAIRLAAQAGKRLCIGSFATGEPDFDLLSLLYPMFRSAKLNGCIFDCHEYGVEGALRTSPSSGALRYREIYTRLPLDCRVPFVISEYWWGNGFEASWPLTEQIADAEWYGREIVKDPYLWWASAFQLDDGAESDFTPEAVAAYTLTAASVQKEEEVVSNKIVGVHSRASGGDLDDLDIVTLQLAGNKLTGFKFTTQDARANHAVIRDTTGILMINCIVRLFWDSSGFSTLPPAADFAEWFRLPISEALADGINVFEFLNEPNLVSEWKWSPAQFVSFAKAVIAIWRQTFPQAIFLTPGLAPDAATVPAWDQAFQEGGLYAACDGIGAHAYGRTAAHLNDDNELRYYRRFAARLTGTKKIWITEASIKFYTTLTPREVGLLYGEYASTLEDYVQGVYFFVLQGEQFASSGEEWTSHQDIPRGLASYVAPPPAARVLDYWLDRDTGEHLPPTNPLIFNITRNMRLRAITRPKQVDPLTCEVDADFGTVTGGGAYAPNAEVRCLWTP